MGLINLKDNMNIILNKTNDKLNLNAEYIFYIIILNIFRFIIQKNINIYIRS